MAGCEAHARPHADHDREAANTRPRRPGKQMDANVETYSQQIGQYCKIDRTRRGAIITGEYIALAFFNDMRIMETTARQMDEGLGKTCDLYLVPDSGERRAVIASFLDRGYKEFLYAHAAKDWRLATTNLDERGVFSGS
ncbi:hypothetical protein CSAL01_13225 [Colletotrichum salicis]|uniref:Uncharacterized protein n=1 Tax=Colletotrichum salicis TaxID=1209931 RepID=A0A135TGQ2_9PEZI|nr:hypothetical protein CSAL01_13225 [Colletotrichum salicis]